MNRRDLLKGSAAFAAIPLLARAAPASALGQPFNYAWLKGHARALASRAYDPNGQTPAPAVLTSLNWDQYQSIHFRPERALWNQDKLPFRIQFFHLGLNFGKAVRIHEVIDGQTREIVYDPAMFDLSQLKNIGTLPKNLGFAGFRIFFQPDFVRDIAAFLGASYFRAVGGDMQYGMSARGLAIDCGSQTPEEFPDFTTFWIERPKGDAKALTIYALLDSPSVAGAYRFDIAPGAVQTMRIDTALYPRKTIERIGIAPLTSMFLCAPNDHRVADDWRPAIHDSDGLAMAAGSGEWLWRPLTNSTFPRFNTFSDNNPRGFGLFQRDRNFDHYEDDGAFYDKRPSVWVEPLSGFGKGSVQLLELPAANETADNIAAFWNTDAKPNAGEEHLFAYRLHWGSKMPAVPTLAAAEMTWTGIGGVVGWKHTYFSWRFVVDFAGGDLAKLPHGAKVEPVVNASSGKLELLSARPLASIKGYRAIFDVVPVDDKPIDLRLFLRHGDRALTETWLYQWTPPPHKATA
jgi:periplasmic glucans biosynthesis protein